MHAHAAALYAADMHQALTAVRQVLATPLAAAIGTGVLVFLLSLMMILVATWRPRRRRGRSVAAVQAPLHHLHTPALPPAILVQPFPVHGFRPPVAPHIPAPPPLPRIERFDLTHWTPPPAEAPAQVRARTPLPPAAHPGPVPPAPVLTMQSAAAPRTEPTRASSKAPLPPAKPVSKPRLPVAKPASKPPLPVMAPASKAPLPAMAPPSKPPLAVMAPPSRTPSALPPSKPLAHARPPSPRPSHATTPSPASPPSAPPPSIEPRVLVLPPPVVIRAPASVPPRPVHLANVSDLDFEDDNPTEFSEPYFQPEELSDGRASHATAPRIRRVEPEAPRFATYESRIMPTAAAVAEDAEPTSRFGRLRAVR